MNIAVNTRFLLNDQEDYGYFINGLFEELVKNHPEHQFYFLFDRPYGEKYVFSSNVHPVVVAPAVKNTVLLKYWYDVKIPFALKKLKADIFVSPDSYLSLTAKIPQCLIVHDLGFLRYPEGHKKSHVRFLKRNTSKFLNKAKTIVTVSEFSKKDIIEHYKVEASKIGVVYYGVKNIFRPLSFDEREVVKGKYTEGAEYFLHLRSIQPRKNLINLLKAFSIFKKRLQSSMKLVITGKLPRDNDEFLELLQTYKYRSDVILIEHVAEEELVSILGAAYAMVYPSLFEGFGLPVAEAMKSEVPVLTSQKTPMQEVAGDAGQYFDPNDHIDIADKMMHIYKDEGLRKQLIEKGIQRSVKYDWQKSAQAFWQSILKTVES